LATFVYIVLLDLTSFTITKSISPLGKYNLVVKEPNDFTSQSGITSLIKLTN